MKINKGYNTKTSLNNNDYNKNSAILDKAYTTNNRGVFLWNLGFCLILNWALIIQIWI